MGAETAPVAGSIRWPACTARVSIFMCRRRGYEFRAHCRSCLEGHVMSYRFFHLSLVRRKRKQKCNCIGITFRFDDAIRAVEIATCIASFDALNSERAFMTIY